MWSLRVDYLGGVPPQRLSRTFVAISFGPVRQEAQPTTEVRSEHGWIPERERVFGEAFSR